MSAVAHWRALGTTAEVAVSEPSALPAARRAVANELARIDAACSRFRDDSELSALNARAGEPVTVGPLLLQALQASLRAARASRGAVDPTIGAALLDAGYDRDFDAMTPDGPPPAGRPAPGWRRVRVDALRRRVTLAPEVNVDLGATAKALAADRAAAAAAAAAAPHGVLVSLGGDVSVRGPAPGGGWAIGIADDHLDREPAVTVLVRAGGLATSSTTQRRWRRAGRELHHILDPRTGLPPAPLWRTVSVAARSCVAANTASTAAIVWGADAPARLAAAGLPARLVTADGRVVRTGGWPADREAA